MPDGRKTWISNGGIADFYTVCSPRPMRAAGMRGISAFIVDADHPGLDCSQAIPLMAPHPLATLVFDGCPVPAQALLGNVGGGFKLAMQTLDIFAPRWQARRWAWRGAPWRRPWRTPSAARCLASAWPTFSSRRPNWGNGALIDAAALLTYRAAWLRDVQGARTTVEAAMAKMVATENAQRVIDMALQMHGGLAWVGSTVEHLYRDIRALRIYEGATEVQQLIIGKSLL